MAKVLVTGGGGYIGSILVQDLLSHSYEVVVLDRFFFGKETLANLASNPRLRLVEKDIRDADISDLEGVSAVCDLAGL